MIATARHRFAESLMAEMLNAHLSWIASSSPALQTVNVCRSYYPGRCGKRYSNIGAYIVIFGACVHRLSLVRIIYRQSPTAKRYTPTVYRCPFDVFFTIPTPANLLFSILLTGAVQISHR